MEMKQKSLEKKNLLRNYRELNVKGKRHSDNRYHNRDAFK